MKKIIFLLFTFIIFNQCSVDDDKPVYHFEVLPIETINLPQTFTLGDTYIIEFTFMRPTSCYAYDQIIAIVDHEKRTLGVKTTVFENNGCTPLTTNITSQQFEFKVLYDQTYLFHIWKGKDLQGNDIYDDIEVPIN